MSAYAGGILFAGEEADGVEMGAELLEDLGFVGKRFTAACWLCNGEFGASELDGFDHEEFA